MSNLFPALLLMATAATTTVPVSDASHVVPAGTWRYLDIQDLIKVDLLDWYTTEPAAVQIDYTVESGPPVRIEIMRRAAVERLSRRPAGWLPASDPQSQGHVESRLPDPGEYSIVIDNRGNNSGPATVRMKIALDYASMKPAAERRLPPARQLTVIAVSFTVFFAIVGLSARSLWRNGWNARR
jgi:hypothetical protein